MSTKELEQKYELAVYPRRDIVLAGGQGARLFDDQGREYIDCASNVGVSNIGHGNETVAKAVYEQYLTLGNCYSMFYNPVRARLAEKLVNLAPGSLNRVFFCNSGAEANEAALKFARSSTGKPEIIACMRGFHGKTMGALAATWGPEYQKPFAPMLPGLKHVPYNNFDKLEAAVGEQTAAVLLEPVQGEGGVRVGDRQYFQKIRDLCSDRHILLIMDEVQTGFGRTGTMFACEQLVPPDMLCLAKSMAGGLPMGAVLCNDRVSVPLKSHTSTFGGNPTACAAALASIDVIERQNLVLNAKTLGDYFQEQLRRIEIQKIREIRGLGLMIGVELKEKAGPYVHKLMDKRVIALLAGATVIRLLPPLVISREEIDTVVKALKEVLAE
ncbi:Adenosylmethionine-8-amino-7-oxononanoate aminotransferase (EC [Olavius sp. associated proteobacterium Delta 1]|nr:Adenosylmethionine-8-amino-7-oxononanoate aminotransferase (EC [Olavius sp. associated proteobacterium Delta 1]